MEVRPLVLALFAVPAAGLIAHYLVSRHRRFTTLRTERLAIPLTVSYGGLLLAIASLAVPTYLAWPPLPQYGVHVAVFVPLGIMGAGVFSLVRGSGPLRLWQFLTRARDGRSGDLPDEGPVVVSGRARSVGTTTRSPYRGVPALVTEARFVPNDVTDVELPDPPRETVPFDVETQGRSVRVDPEGCVLGPVEPSDAECRIVDGDEVTVLGEVDSTGGGRRLSAGDGRFLYLTTMAAEDFRNWIRLQRRYAYLGAVSYVVGLTGTIWLAV